MKKNGYFMAGIDIINAQLPIGFKFENLCSDMRLLLDIAKGKTDLEDRKENKHGYFTVMNGLSGEILFTVPFGEIPVDKAEKFFEFSQEKALRLWSQRSMNLPVQHTTSHESRNEMENKFGGAVYSAGTGSFPKLIFSFSGMPELIDEAMMMAFVKKSSNDHHASNNNAYERNPYWKNIYNEAVKYCNF